MAGDSKKFDLELGTKADLSGLEATERGLKAVAEAGEDAAEATNPMTDGSQLAAGASKAAVEVDAYADSLGEAEAAVADLEQSVEALREAQQKADVQTAERLKAQREYTATEEAATAAQDAQIARAGALGAVALVAKGAWTALSQAVQEYRRLAPEAAEEFREPFDTIQLAIQTVTSPLETLIEGLTGTQTSLKNLAASQAEAARQEAQYLELKARRETELTAKNEARVNGSLQRELAVLDQINAAYDRRLATLAAVTAEEEKLARLQDAIALTNGADPARIAANQAARAAAARATATEGLVTEAEQGLDRAIAERDALVSALVQANATLGPLSESAQSLSEQARLADEGIEQAKADLQAAKERQQAAMIGLAAEQLDVTLQATQAAQAEVASRTAQVVEVTTAGDRELSQAQAAAAERIRATLADGRVTATEQQGLTNDLQVMMQGFRGTLADQQQLTAEFTEIVRLGNQNTAAVAREQAMLKRELAEVRRLVESGL